MNRAITIIQKHPLPALFCAVIILALVLWVGSGLLVTFNHWRQDTAVTKLEQEADEKNAEAAKSLDQANKDSIDRAVEDALRDRNIAPQIQRTAQSSATARARTQAAEADYQRTVQTAPPIAPDNPQLKEFTAQMKSAQELISAQKTEIQTLDQQLKTEKEYSASVDKSYAVAKSEIANLRDTVKAKDEVIAAKNETIAVLTDQRDEARKDAKKWKKRAAIVTVAATIIGILR